MLFSRSRLNKVSLYNRILKSGVSGAVATQAKPDVKRTDIKKILIANRGEIACRIIHTCKRMGIQTVAVYSDVDARSLHVTEADESYNIGPAASRESYLNIDKIVNVIKRSGAQAVHPGYGFLSENAGFVGVCEQNGVIFIGPDSSAMNAMGDKINSKKLAASAGVNTIPGFKGEIESEAAALKISREIGYPVMVKASGGGGGKGLRIAYNDAQVKEAFRLCKDEASAAFANDKLLIEKFIENPHHIEIQVLGDSYGHVVAFPERECSVQRRNQKVFEESPSCFIDPTTRRKMQEQAIMLARAVNYKSAGTVEMLVDDKKNFYFLEMNTRLQVEHPITEFVSGEDLVEHMIRVASGEPLPSRLTDSPCLHPRGHAIEARVYAEDPVRGFLPSIGTLVRYEEPIQAAFDRMRFSSIAEMIKADNAVRIDSGVYEGWEISMHYDPMIAKAITYGQTRLEAIRSLEDTLDSYVVWPVGNNLGFLRDVLRNKTFLAGIYDTNFIPSQYPNGFKNVSLSNEEEEELSVVAAIMSQAFAKRNEGVLVSDVNWDYKDGFEPLHVTLSGQDKRRRIELSSRAAFNTYVKSLKTLNQPTRRVAVKKSKKGGEEDDAENQAYFKITEYPAVMSEDEESTYKTTDDSNKEDDDDDDDDESGAKVTYVNVNSKLWRLGDSRFFALFDGANRECVVLIDKLDNHSGDLVLRYKGSHHAVKVNTDVEQDYSRHMLPEKEKDLSGVFQSPMPGKMISIAVSVGDVVQQGQELGVIDAMKMRNVLRAGKVAKIKKVLVKPGDQARVDQVLFEFEDVAN